MVSKYRRYSSHSSYGPDVLQKALDAVREGMSKNKASKEFGVPRRTLARHLSGQVLKPLCKLGRFLPALGDDFEAALEEHVLEMQKMMFGLTCTDLRKLAFQIAVKKGLKHPFNEGKQQAGKAWLQGFLRRHPTISLRNPEATSLSRAVAFNKPSVMKFFDIYKGELQKHAYSADRIWNVDETGMSTVQRPGKVLAKKGQKQVGRITSAERGQNMTVVGAINAAGTYAPPMLIFKRIRMSSVLMAGTPAGSVGYPSASGWINSELFVKWLEHFIAFAKPSKEKKVILILDGHASHKTLEAVELCREHGIVMICLPPHTTHQVQPLDKTVYGPLKRNYNEECDRWLLKNAGQRITMYEQGALFGAAFVKTASMQKAVNGFQSTGLWPFNPEVFSEEDFLPSMVTDEPAPVEMEIIAEVPSSNVDVVPAEAPAQSQQITSSTVAYTDAPCSQCDEKIPEDLTTFYSAETVSTDSNATVPSAQSENDEVAPMDVIHEISPLPKSQKQRTRQRKPQSAAVVTSSPFKQQLVESSRDTKQKKKVAKQPIADAKSRSKKKVTCRGQNVKKKLNLPREPKKKCRPNAAQEYRCIYCNELFVDPPEEDWMQCTSCKEWYHEQCGNDGDVCDLCNDD